MLDINLIRENPKLVKESQKKRGMPVEDIDTMLKLDKDWRDLKQEVDNLRARRNKLSEEINQAKKKGKSASSLIKEARELPLKLEKDEKEMNENKLARDNILKNIPNILDKSVPQGDASKFKLIKEYGKNKERREEGHAEIMEKLDLIDVKKASEVAGARFYYLKRELVKLNHAIIDFALDFLEKKKFIFMQPPYMLKKEILDSALTFDAFQDAIYKIDGEDLYLIGTAEHALNAYHYNETLDTSKLPLRYAGVSPCFRKEAGAHGKDTKGIFRVHQFEKIEQFIFCKPEQAWKEFDLILDNTIEMFKLLEIPFRVIILASGDTGRVPCKTIDLEGWFPSQNTYRELASCSNCTDYQARRGNVKFQEKGETKLVNTLNNTAIATERMMCCLIENGYQKDGSVKIPKALQKYTGFKEIKSRK